jgi:hypothetical protein
MAESNSGREPGFDDFRRYRDGEMSPREAHLLEKQMLDNPLIAEAYEGFLALNEDHVDYKTATDDLSQSLNDRINPSQRKVIPFLQYAAVASLIVGFGVGGLVLVLNKNEKPEPVASGHVVAPKQNVTAEEQPESLIITYPTTTAFQSAPKEDQVARPSREISVTANDPEQADFKEDSGLLKINEERIAAAERVTAEAPLAVPQRAFAASSRQQILTEKSKVKVGQDDAAGLSYNSSAHRASPVDGWDAYQLYLAKSTSTAAEDGEVIVNFIVNADSTLTAFDTKGSSLFYEQAIRIIQNGPAWVPAKSNGQFVTTQTTLVLKFRKTK